MKMVSRLACSLAFALAASAACADPVWVGFPGPGETLSSFTGPGPTAGIGTGGTATWSALDFSGIDHLWWAPTSIKLGSTVTSVTTLTTSGTPSGLTEVWTGMVTLPGTGSLNARFTATIVSGASGWIDPTTVGIPTSGPNSAPAVAEITSSTFTLNWLFEVNPGGGFVPFLTYYDSLTAPANSSVMSVSGGFYDTVTVPSPALGAGLPGVVLAALGMVGFARRRRQRLV
jgi:hypothetical protein